MSVPTLYGISAELLNLMEAREAILADWALSNTDQTTSLAEVESAIREQVSALVRKVDGAAFYVREFEARAAAAKAEKERNRDREHMWEARGERLKEYIVSVMQMMGATRLDGDSNTLRLQKCPPSVEIAQPELVPAEYRQVNVPMSEAMWNRLVNVLFEHDRELWQMFANRGQPNLTDFKLMKTPIKEALKRGDGVPGCVLVTDKMSLRVE